MRTPPAARWPACVAVVLWLATAACGRGAPEPQRVPSVAAEVTLADGTVCRLCLWRAETAEQRRRGLMHYTDLGGADGMVFLFGAPTTTTFWMRDTPLPLSIAFFAADGTFVSATDMEPCVDGPAAGCPHYRAAGPYATAVEVPAGRLGELGIGPGSRLRVGATTGCADAA